MGRVAGELESHGTVSCLHVDQRPTRARCEEILARVPAPEAVEHDVARGTAYLELLQSLLEIQLIPGTTPEGVSKLLLRAHDTGDPATWRRCIERAIPSRGRLRRGPAVGAVTAVIGIVAALTWISPWLLWMAAVLVTWLGVRALRCFVDHRAGPVNHVAWMERAARTAAQADDVETVSALHVAARQMIADDRVPAGVGFRLATVLGAAARTTASPLDLLRELRQLLLIAPETELSYAQVRDDLERHVRNHVDRLAARIRRALREGETGPRLDEVLDQIEALIVRLEGTDGALAARACAPRQLVELLDEIGKHAPGARERADALRARIAAAPVSPRRRLPALPDGDRRASPTTALHAAVAAIGTAEELRPHVVAHYRRARDAASRGHERSQRDLVTAMRLAATWASKREVRDATLLGEIRDDVRELLARRRLPAGTGAELAGVLRECVGADPFPGALLDDYAALHALAPDLVAPHFWSIVDAAILRIEARLGELTRAGGLDAEAALRDIAAAFAATAACARDPEIARRARELARLGAPRP